MGAGRRLLVQGLLHHPLDRLGAQRRLAPRPRRIAAQPGDALAQDSAPASGQTVNLLLPTDRAIAITPTRSADSSTIRARQTSFCGVFRAEIQPSNVARSAGDSQMHAEVLFMPPELHAAGSLGIFR